MPRQSHQRKYSNISIKPSRSEEIKVSFTHDKNLKKEDEKDKGIQLNIQELYLEFQNDGP